MQNAMKEEIKIQYSEILCKLKSNWEKQYKKKYEESLDSGLGISGVGVKKMYNLIEELVMNTLNEIESMLKNIEIEYNLKINLNYMKDFKKKASHDIESHISNMQKELEEFLKTYSLESAETNKSHMITLKYNVNYRMQRLYDSRKNLKKFKRIDWIVIINTVIAFLSLIVAIIGLLKPEVVQENNHIYIIL